MTIASASDRPSVSPLDRFLSVGLRHRAATIAVGVVVLVALVPVALMGTQAIGYSTSTSGIAGSQSAEVQSLLSAAHPSRSTLFVAVPLSPNASSAAFCQRAANFTVRLAADAIADYGGTSSACSAAAQWIDLVTGPAAGLLRSSFAAFGNLSAEVYGFPAAFLSAWTARGATFASINASCQAAGAAPGYDRAVCTQVAANYSASVAPPLQVDRAVDAAAPAAFPGSRTPVLLAEAGVGNATEPPVVARAAATWINRYAGLPTPVDPALVLAYGTPGDPGTNYVLRAGFGALPAPLRAPFVSPDGTLALVDVVFNVSEGYRGPGGFYPAQAATPVVRDAALQFFGPAAGVTGDGATAYDTAALTASTGFLFGLTFLVLLAAVIVTLRSLWAALFTLVFLGVGFEAGYVAIFVAGALTGPVNYVVSYILEAVILGIVTDYLVFFFYRVREELRGGTPRSEAARRASATAGRAILTSGIIVAVGLGILSLLPGLVGWGLVLALAVAGSAVAMALLLPVVADAFGPRLFLRRGLRPASAPIERSRFYRGSAWAVRHRGAVLLVVALVGIPSVTFLLVAPTSYNLSQGLPSSLPSVRAQDAITAAFGAGVIYPTYVVVPAPSGSSFALPNGSLNPATEPLLRATASDLLRTAGVGTATGPFVLGNRTANASASGATEFLLDGGRYAYYVVGLTSDPFGDAAMGTVATLRTNASWLVGGVTAALVDQRAQNAVDYPLIEIGLVVLIAVILGLSFRSLTIPLVSLAGVFVSIGATFVLLSWIASVLLHQTVIYLIPLILIVILLSLGNDYTVFLLSRIVEEGRTRRIAEAIPRGIAFSGVVVTSLGLILAASLGSLALQPVSFLEQLGLAFGLSLVLDTFVIRILYFPAALRLAGPRSVGAGGAEAPAKGPPGGD
ncbi:MAG: MMPL family transporter [Thermoplasmata archaeon]